MKDKELIIVPLVITIVGIILNFPEFLMGSPATVKNLFVSAIYLGAWIFVIKKSSNNRKQGISMVYLLFWFVTLFFSFVTVYVNVSEAIADWAIPFVILFLTQWYGLTIFIDSHHTFAISIALISLVMVIANIVLLIKSKKI